MTELTQWFSEHQQWILLATCLLAFFESLALVGIVIPGVALLFATSVAAGSASINIWEVLTAGFIGAICGDGISFLLGRYSHETITQLPPFNKHPEWIRKGEDFFQKHGIASIIIGRFIGPVRPVMPLVAGMLEMPAARFFSVNITSALVWSPFYLLPGYIIGAAAENQQLVQQHHFFLLCGLIGIPWLISTCLLYCRSRLQNQLQRQKASILVFSLAAMTFLATYILTISGYLQSIDSWGLNTLTALRLPFIDTFFIAITLLGYWMPMAIWCGAITLTLIFQRHFTLTAIWIGAVLMGQFSISWLKNATALARPAIVEHPPASYSFPSGHTAITIVFMGTLLLLVRNNLSVQGYRIGLIVCSAVCTLVACSRLYLGVHWISDIIAGICLGLMILAAVYGLLQQQARQIPPPKSASPKSLIFATCAGILCAYTFSVIPSFDDNRKHYQLTHPLHGGKGLPIEATQSHG